MVLWPNSTAEVDVTLCTRGQGKYRSLIEVVAFDSGHSQCLDVIAEVQLPRLRLSLQHVHFPVTYVKTASPPMILSIRNDADMPAEFTWKVPVRLESCLCVEIDKVTGMVPPWCKRGGHSQRSSGDDDECPPSAERRKLLRR